MHRAAVGEAFAVCLVKCQRRRQLLCFGVFPAILVGQIINFDSTARHRQIGVRSPYPVSLNFKFGF